jgi:hypothetical protein
VYFLSWEHVYQAIAQKWSFTESLVSNGSTHHIAPFLRLFIPNGLQAYHHFFSSEGCACDVHDQSRLPPPPGFVFTMFTLQLLPP